MMRPEDDRRPRIIPPEVIGIGLRLAFFIVVPAIILMLVTPYRSEGFMISLLSLVMGLGLLGIVLVLAWLSRRL